MRHNDSAAGWSIQTWLKTLWVGYLKEAEFKPRFSFHSVNCKQVEQIIALLPSNKAPGFDKISARVIKDGLSVILSPITHVINASLTNGIFPVGWKQAEVTPIPKEEP